MPELIRTRWPARVLRIGVLAVLASSLGSLGCGKALSDDECTHLLDRYTEMLAKSQNAKIPAQRVLELQERARELARQDPAYEFADCSKRVSRRNFECAMQAPSVDEMERCLIF
jgi:hypothetical protein